MLQVALPSERTRARLFFTEQAWGSFFFVGYFCWLIGAILETSLLVVDLGFELKILKYISIPLLFLSELARFESNRREPVGMIIALFCMAMAIFTKANNVALSVLLVFCSRGIDFDRLAKSSLVLGFGCVLMVISLSIAGVIEDVVVVHGDRTRHYLGFRYALFPSQYLFLFTGLVLYLRRNRGFFIDSLLLISANCAIFILTDSRLSFFLSVAMIVLVSFARLRELRLKKKMGHSFKKRRLPAMYGIAVGSFLVCLGVSVVLTVTYDPLRPALNNLLGGRLFYGNQALFDYGIPFFSQPTDFNGNGLGSDGSLRSESIAYNYVDSLYILLLVKYGSVFSVLWVGAMTWVCADAYRHKEKVLLIILAFVAIHCAVDDLMIFLNYNTFLFLVAGATRDRQRSCSEELHGRKQLC